MLKRNQIIIALALTISVSAFAGTEGGGGENSVVCFKDGKIPAAIRDPQSPRFGQLLDSELKEDVVSVEAYDLYEALMPRGLDRQQSVVININPKESVREYTERIAQRFAPYIPSITTIIQTGSDRLIDQRIIMRPTGLNRIHDENDVGSIDSSRCIVVTMAAQYKAGDETFLQLDGRLYGNAHHSRLSQGIMFLHESIYYTARNLGQETDSRTTRALVSALIDGSPITSLQLVNLLARLRMPFSKNLDNYLSIMAAKLIEANDGKAYLKDIYQADNDRLVKKYNAWAAETHVEWVNFGIIDRPSSSRVQNGDKIERDRDGHFPDFESRTGLSSNCENGNRCLPGAKALSKDYKAMPQRLAGLMKAYWEGVLKEKVFPAIDKATQFDLVTREKAKKMLSESFQQGEVREWNSEYFFRFEGYQSPAEKLRELDFLIP